MNLAFLYIIQLKPEENVVDSLTIGAFNFKQKRPFNKKKKGKKRKSSETTQC